MAHADSILSARNYSVFNLASEYSYAAASYALGVIEDDAFSGADMWSVCARAFTEPSMLSRSLIIKSDHVPALYILIAALYEKAQAPE